jgi:endo-alpha-1,4-polygalactosaminidase (GH114 family)
MYSNEQFILKLKTELLLLLLIIAGGKGSGANIWEKFNASIGSWFEYESFTLIQESTKSAEVISTGERSGHDGLTVYEIEYSLDSTRGGMKRIFTAAFVASRKLYLLNVAHSDTEEKPLDKQTRLVLEEVLHSFDTV